MRRATLTIVGDVPFDVLKPKVKRVAKTDVSREVASRASGHSDRRFGLGRPSLCLPLRVEGAGDPVDASRLLDPNLGFPGAGRSVCESSHEVILSFVLKKTKAKPNIWRNLVRTTHRSLLHIGATESAT
jgi:hypothetical protein